jgi:membrane-bound lytic murein transglycosylase A
MGTPLRVLAVFMLAVLAIAAAKECGTQRGPSWSPLSTGSIHHADLPDASSILDAGAGPRSIPNAALELVGWGDLDGWTSDDHAVAFATFNASCRAIARAVAFRAESETDHAADPRPARAALEQVCIRAIKAGGLGSETARQLTNFVPVGIRKLGGPAGFVTGYYDPIFDGSRFPTREFTVPLYRLGFFTNNFELPALGQSTGVSSSLRLQTVSRGWPAGRVRLSVRRQYNALSRASIAYERFQSGHFIRRCNFV